MQDNIDDYLLNRMSDSQKIEFEKCLSENSELKEKVEIQKLVIDDIRYRAKFNSIINNIEPKNTSRKKHLGNVLITILSIAAIFIGIIIVSKIVENSKMDNLYSQLYNSPVKRDSNGITRGNSELEIYNFIHAVDLLQNNKPEQAEIELLKLYVLPTDYLYFEDVRWYLGLTGLKLHQKSKAKKYFRELLRSEVYGEKAKIILGSL